MEFPPETFLIPADLGGLQEQTQAGGAKGDYRTKVMGRRLHRADFSYYRSGRRREETTHTHIQRGDKN